MRLRPHAAGSRRPHAAILLSALTFPAGAQTDATPAEQFATMRDRMALHLSAVPGGAMNTVLVGHDAPFRRRNRHLPRTH